MKCPNASQQSQATGCLCNVMGELKSISRDNQKRISRENEYYWRQQEEKKRCKELVEGSLVVFGDLRECIANVIMQNKW